ncbi:hypothetical protein C8R45DRAFT_1027494 [Mycena sanguinolenta]|nr:hypothetical protein C8R45DRAFT_1027494 [Mycena sanguinolenta]
MQRSAHGKAAPSQAAELVVQPRPHICSNASHPQTSIHRRKKRKKGKKTRKRTTKERNAPYNVSRKLVSSLALYPLYPPTANSERVSSFFVFVVAAAVLTVVPVLVLVVVAGSLDLLVFSSPPTVMAPSFLSIFYRSTCRTHLIVVVDVV